MRCCDVRKYRQKNSCVINRRVDVSVARSLSQCEEAFLSPLVAFVVGERVEARFVVLNTRVREKRTSEEQLVFFA